MKDHFSPATREFDIQSPASNTAQTSPCGFLEHSEKCMALVCSTAHKLCVLCEHQKCTPESSTWTCIDAASPEHHKALHSGLGFDGHFGRCSRVFNIFRKFCICADVTRIRKKNSFMRRLVCLAPVFTHGVGARWSATDLASCRCFFLVCPAQLVNMSAHTWRSPMCNSSAAHSRISCPFDLSRVSRAGTQSDGCVVLGLSQHKHRTEAFIATTWLRSQLRVRHSSGQQGRSSPSDVHECYRPSDQFACANTSSLMDCGPTVVSSEACRSLNAAQKIFIAVAGLCLQLGSPNSFPLQRMAAHGKGAELPAGITRGAYDPSGRCLRKPFLPRRRDCAPDRATGQ